MALKQLTVTTRDGVSGSSDATVTYQRSTGKLNTAEQRVAFGDLTDGGGASGTITLNDSIPEGSVVLGAKIDVETAFSGDGDTASITMNIGDGSDADRFGDSVDLTAAGIVAEDVVGEVAISADTDVVLTVTEAVSASGTLDADLDGTLDNTAVVDNEDGTVDIAITAHGMVAGQTVVIAGTTNYDGTYVIDAVTTNAITVTATYVAETPAGTETWDAASAAGDNGDGTVRIPIAQHGLEVGRLVTLASTTNYNDTYAIVAVPDANHIDITETHAAETFAGTETWTAAGTFGQIDAGQMVVTVLYGEM